MRRGRLTDDLRPSPSEESVAELGRGRGARIERIVSMGQVSPPGFWYDQEENEWVLLVQGAARLEVEGHGDVQLEAGDWLELHAHERHRVTWTEPGVVTLWLAVFYAP